MQSASKQQSSAENDKSRKKPSLGNMINNVNARWWAQEVQSTRWMLDDGES